MKLMDFLSGRVRPPVGVAPQPPEAVRAALLALDRASAPYTVRAATPQEQGDLVAEWRIVDARWCELFAQNRLSKSLTVFLQLDPATRTVRAVDRLATLQWGAGWPRAYVETEVQWGRIFEKSAGARIGFTEELRPGLVYKYRFATSEIKGPLKATVASMGWTWQAVASSRL